MSDTSNESIEVLHVPNAHRFTITVDGSPAGFAQYVVRADGAVFDFTHTEIDPAFGGRGLGSKLISVALAESHAAGKTILPRCPFVAAWLRKHPDFPGEISWP